MDDDNIQYSAENYAPARQGQPVGGLSGLVIRMGLAKDEKSANTVLMGILVVCVVVGVGVWFVV